MTFFNIFWLFNFKFWTFAMNPFAIMNLLFEPHDMNLLLEPLL
jgi:hypothetical protein